MTAHVLRAEEYKRLRALIMGPGKGKQGLMQQMSKQMGRGGNMNPHNMQMNIQQMSRMLPPQASPHALRCFACCTLADALCTVYKAAGIAKTTLPLARDKRLDIQMRWTDYASLMLQVLKQMGGAGALQGLLKQMEGMK